MDAGGAPIGDEMATLTYCRCNASSPTQLFEWDPATLQLKNSGHPGGCLGAERELGPLAASYATISPCSAGDPSQRFRARADQRLQNVNHPTNYCLDMHATVFLPRCLAPARYLGCGTTGIDVGGDINQVGCTPACAGGDRAAP